jgi:copper(I)-binding protein
MRINRVASWPFGASLAVVAVMALVSLSSASSGAEFKAGDITVETPWSRATPGGAKVAAGYLIIKNGAETPDRLISATTEIAGQTEIHQMSMTDGMMKMRQITDGVPVPAHGSVALEPNSYHLMLLDLKESLKEGETFAGTLTFEEAGAVDVTFEVKGIGAAAPGEGADHNY